MNFESAVLHIKRELSMGLPVLPYVRRFGQLLKPPIKTERPSSPTPLLEAQNNRLRTSCPREVRVPLIRVQATTLERPIIKTEGGSSLPQLSPSLYCKREVVIRLKRIKSYSRYAMGSSNRVNYDAAERRTAVVSLTRVDKVLPPTTLDIRRTVKLEPRKESRSGSGTNPRAPVQKLMQLCLKRIDDNILFHIKINNPEAVNPRERTPISPELPAPSPLFQYTPGNQQLFGVKLERFHERTIDADPMEWNQPPDVPRLWKAIKVEKEGSSSLSMVKRRRGRPPKFPKREVEGPKRISRRSRPKTYYKRRIFEAKK